jgi:signal transduction histidine kinase
LVSNGIKFTHAGQVVLRVETAPDTDPDANSAKLQFSVRDTGIGIPLEKQTLIFEAFSQADTSTTRQYGGTGLGLTITRQLVELMGGELTLASRPNEGSTFYFTIPLQRQ